MKSHKTPHSLMKLSLIKVFPINYIFTLHRNNYDNYFSTDVLCHGSDLRGYTSFIRKTDSITLFHFYFNKETVYPLLIRLVTSYQN